MKKINVEHLKIKRGQLFFADLGADNIVGSEQRGQRPVIVLSNDVGNTFSPTVEVAIITSQLSKAKLPTHVEIDTRCGLLQDSVILIEQKRTIDKKRLVAYIGAIDDELTKKVNKAIEVSLAVGHKAKTSRVERLINEKIFDIHSIEMTIKVLEERKMLSEDMFQKLYTERGTKLDILEKFCKINDKNYLDYYKPVDYRQSFMAV